MEELHRQGRVEFRPKGKVPRLKRYLDEAKGMPVQSVWTDIRPLINFGNESLGYPTQKPEGLLERIIRASSDEGQIVLDPFCGSGTTCIAAVQNNRSYIAYDIKREYVELAEKRISNQKFI